MKKYSLNRYERTSIHALLGRVIRKMYETLIELITIPKLKEPFRHLPFSEQAMQKLLADLKFFPTQNDDPFNGKFIRLIGNHLLLNFKGVSFTVYIYY